MNNISVLFIYVVCIHHLRFVHKSTKRAKSDKKKDMIPLSYHYRTVQLLTDSLWILGWLPVFWTLAILHSAACYIKVS